MKHSALHPVLAAFFLCATPIVQAAPLYTYSQVAKWADGATDSTIPKASRVYVVGPDKGPGVCGGPDGTPVLRLSKNHHAIDYKQGLSLAEILRDVPAVPPKTLGVNVYRAGAPPNVDPVFTAKLKEGKNPNFVVQPRDIIHVFYIDPTVPMLPNN